jgi:hypothetical protein
MLRAGLTATAIWLATAIAPPAAQHTDEADLLSARSFAEATIANLCRSSNHLPPASADHPVFHFSFRTKGHDQDSPDHRRTLVQLPCSDDGHNTTAIWVMRDDETGRWHILSFAEPRADFDYVDEAFSQLVAPPTVSGYSTSSTLANSRFDPNTLTISARLKWRGGTGAWSAGEWRFEDRAFVLKRYEVDPTYQAPDDTRSDHSGESYILFGPSGD